MRSLIALLLLTASMPAQAKDLRKRFGLGFNTEIGQVTALSARYGLPTPDPVINVQIELDFGMDPQANAPDKLYGGGRLLYALVSEDNLNLYAAAGAGALSDGTNTSLRIQPALSVDFFLFGLENLGFNTTWGVNLDIGGGTTGVATTVSVGAGAHYFF